MARLVEDCFQSNLLGRCVSYQAIFPENFENERRNKNYPVLYLLHGLFGNFRNWLELTDLYRQVNKSSFAAVMVDGGNSWYTDTPFGNGERYESFFVKEFIPFIDKKYKVGGSKKLRAVAGLSMGGFGAVKFAVKHPHLFVFAASMSGAFDAPRQSFARPGPDWSILRESLTNVFGRKPRNKVRTENDLFRLISGLPGTAVLRLPQFYFACGKSDSFLKVNRELSRLFRLRKISLDYYETDGQHDWDYWNRELVRILRQVELVFGKEN